MLIFLFVLNIFFVHVCFGSFNKEEGFFLFYEDSLADEIIENLSYKRTIFPKELIIFHFDIDQPINKEHVKYFLRNKKEKKLINMLILL